MANDSTGEVRYFIGYDLGHAETAICALPNDSGSRIPEPLRLQNLSYWPTAYSKSPRGCDIGKTAIDAIKNDQAGELFLAFKAKPDENATAGAKLAEYTRLVWNQLSSNPELKASHKVFLGCPSAWEMPSRDKYESITMQTLPNSVVRVVGESRGAMFQALSIWTELNMRGSFYDKSLVIDVGSSTVDFTAVKSDIDPPYDTGAEVGAGIIDAIILAKLGKWNSSAEVGEFISNAPENMRHKLLFMCRNAKERYFTQIFSRDDKGNWRPNSADDERNAVHCETEYFLINGRRQRIEVELTADRMREVMSTPISILGGQNWPEAFANVIAALRDKLVTIDYSVNKIILTGGASKMPVVQQIVRATFPECAIAPAGEPSLFIASGLSRACRHDYYSQRVKAEFIIRIDSDIERLLTARYTAYKDDLARRFSEEIVNRNIMPVLEKWRNGYITTLENTKADISDASKRFFAGSRPFEIWRDRTAVLQKSVKLDFMAQEDVGRICSRYGYDREKLMGAVVKNENVPERASMPSSVTKDMMPDVTSIFSILIAILAVVLVALTAGILSLVIVPLVAAGGAEYVLANVELPARVRKAMMSDKKRDEIRDDLIGKLKEEMLAGFGADFEKLRKHLAREIRSDVERAVADETRFIR